MGESVCLRVSIAVIKHQYQRHFGEGGKDLFQLATTRSHSIIERTQGRNSRQEPGGKNDAGAVGEHCLLACSLNLSQADFVYI